MDLINALFQLSKRTDTVQHSQGEVWDINTLMDHVNTNSTIPSSDDGEWTQDGDGILHLDRNGYHNGQRYDIV